MDRARLDGFALAPMAMLQPIVTASNISNADAMAKFIDRNMLLVVTGVMDFRGHTFDFCAVGVMPPDARAARDLQDWTRVSQMPSERAGINVYVYVDGPDGSRRSALGLTDAQFRQAITEGHLHAAGVMENSTIAILLYGVAHRVGTA
jgi:hypothetical protein